MMDSRNNLIYITIFLGALFQSLFLFLHDIRFLILNTIPDDGFYYMQIARNIVNGCGSTMDCVNITNGYHPLWMSVLLPIFKFFSVGGVNDIVPIYLALFVSICFGVLSAFYLSKILRRFTNNFYIISFSVFAYMFNPYVLYNVLNGLETGLLLFVLSYFIYRSLIFSENATTKNAFYFGLVGGVLALARLDMVVVVAFSLIYVLYKSSIKNFLYSVFASQIFFIPWFVYNYITFNMLFTSASATSTFINHRLTYGDNGGYSLFLFLKTVVYMLDRAVNAIFTNTGASIIVLMLTGVFIYLLIEKRKEYINAVLQRNLNPIIFILAGSLALVFISAGLRWTFRTWYFIPLLLFFSIMFAFTLERLREKDFPINKILITLVSLFIFFFYISYEKDLKGNQVLQGSMFDVAKWQNENLPIGTHIGVFNSGIQTYFSKHKVTNLDGLVNGNASKAMLNNTLWQYIIEKEKIDYISDFDSYLTYRYRESFRDKEGNLINPLSTSTASLVHTITGAKDLNIYKLKYE